MGRETQKLPTQQGENGGYKYPILRCIYLLIAGKSFPLTKLNRKPEGKGRLVWFTEVSLPGTYQDEKDREWNWSCNSFPLSVTHSFNATDLLLRMLLRLVFIALYLRPWSVILDLTHHPYN